MRQATHEKTTSRTSWPVVYVVQVSQFGFVGLNSDLDRSVSLSVTLKGISGDSNMTRKAARKRWNAKHKYFRYSRWIKGERLNEWKKIEDLEQTLGRCEVPD